MSRNAIKELNSEKFHTICFLFHNLFNVNFPIQTSSINPHIHNDSEKTFKQHLIK